MRLVLAVLLAAVALSGCNQKRKDRDPLDLALDSYHSVMMWGEIEQVIAFQEPKLRVEKPIPAFELERWRQIDVSGYHAQAHEFLTPERVRQVVQLDIVNRHTMASRTITDVQEWTWDEEAKRWWLVSGLPELGTAR